MHNLGRRGRFEEGRHWKQGLEEEGRATGGLRGEDRRENKTPLYFHLKPQTFNFLLASCICVVSTGNEKQTIILFGFTPQDVKDYR